MKTQHFIAVAVVVILAGVGAFFGGTVYEKNQLQKQGANRSGNAGQRRAPGVGPGGSFGQGGANGNGDFIGGQVTAKDDKSVTIKMRNGSTKIVFFSDTTKVGKAVEGSASDIQTSENVTVMGKTNPDGSISAQNIQIRPQDQQNQ